MQKNTIQTDLIEKIIDLGEKIKKYAEKNLFKGKGITMTQFNILWEVNKSWKISINKLKENLITSQASLSQLINRMEASWLLNRELSKNDRREIILWITDKWRKIYDEINNVYIFSTKDKLSEYSEKDITFVTEFLEKLNQTIHKHL